MRQTSLSKSPDPRTARLTASSPSHGPRGSGEPARCVHGGLLPASTPGPAAAVQLRDPRRSHLPTLVPAKGAEGLAVDSQGGQDAPKAGVETWLNQTDRLAQPRTVVSHPAWGRQPSPSHNLEMPRRGALGEGRKDPGRQQSGTCWGLIPKLHQSVPGEDRPSAAPMPAQHTGPGPGSLAPHTQRSRGTLPLAPASLAPPPQ